MQRRRGKRKPEGFGNINININTKTNTCRKREETSTVDEDTKPNTNKNNIVGNGRMPALFSAASKRRWLRGNRKKVFVESLIVFTSLCFWISLFRFEYDAMQSPKYHNNTAYRKHQHSVEIGPGARDRDRNSDNDNDNDNGIVSNSRIKSHAYDSIFCRTKSFQIDKDNSSRTGQNASQHHQTTKPVFLWGIPSTTSESETRRRTLLRKTYLDFYQKIHGDEDYQKTTAAVKTTNATRFSDNHPSNTICSFHDWTCKPEVRVHCQMIYVFFVGGHESFHNNETAAAADRHNNNHNHPKGAPPPPPSLLNESITDFREMLLSPDEYKNAKGEGFDFHEPGTVYLDIRENQFEGKMTTWFKFASLVATEYNAQTQAANTVHPKIEYVFKVDSDLLLFTPHFIHWFEGVHGEQQQLQGIKLPQQQLETTKSSSGGGGLLPSTPALVRRVYGGIEFPPTFCDKNFTFDHPCPLPLSGPSYMSGELNFLSVDLAIYIASDDCPRDQWTIPHEDVSLSNYVYSYTNNTTYPKKREEIQPVGNRNTLNSNSNQNSGNKKIHIVGVNTSKILLLPNMRANWETVSIRKNPEVLQSGELLWGHSIKRGNYTQYLYWKKDSKFRSFWLLFYKVYTRTGNVMRSSLRKKKNVPDSGNDAASIFRSAVQQNLKQNQQRNGTNTAGKRVGKDIKAF
jgi:hypothetical protein